jgi:hypothetical protein
LRFRLSAAFAALFSLALLGAARGRTDPALQQGGAQTHTVTIVFQCGGTRSVSPWQLRIRQGDNVDWVLDDASDVTEFEIVKKRTLQRWIFDDGRPSRGRRGEPARGRGMRQNARGTHAYNIEAMCPGPGNSMQKAVIDPDIIVD